MSTAKATKQPPSQKTIQQLAADALNCWRDHVKIVADALEEVGEVARANRLREDLGDFVECTEVDHRATRSKLIEADYVAKNLIALVKPAYYLVRRLHKDKTTIQVHPRDTRKKVYSFIPEMTKIIDGGDSTRLGGESVVQGWESHTANFVHRDNEVQLFIQVTSSQE